MMRRMEEGGARNPRRRALVLGALAAPVLLAGCGVRLEDDAPPLPLIPSREPLAGEDELTALTRACVTLAELALATPGATATALVPAHRRQHTVLRTTLVRRGVPVQAVDGAAGPAATPSASGSGSTGRARAAAAAVAALADAEGSAAAGVDAFADVDEEFRDTVHSLHAQRFAAAVLLSGRAPEVAGEPVRSEAVEELASRTETARYFLEVVAARSTGRARTRATTTRDALARLLADQVAAGSAPERTMGVPLPFEVGTAAEATRLARESLDELRSAHGTRLAALRDSHGVDGWAAGTRWLGTVEAECHRWGLPLEPFPGLE
jgi:hypothetical protein